MASQKPNKQMRSRPKDNSGAEFKSKPKKITNPTIQRLNSTERLNYRISARICIIALLMAAVRCPLAAPVTGCTAVSTNTGTGLPTTLTATNLAMSLSEPLPAATGELQFFVTSSDTGNKEIRFFKHDGSRKFAGVMTGSGTNYKSVILKDPLKLVVGSFNSNKLAVYPVTESAGVYTLGTVVQTTPSENIGLLLSDKGSAFIFVQSKTNNKVFKYDMSLTLINTRSTGAFDNVNAFYMALSHDGAKVFMGTPTYFSLYNKADFSQVKGFQYDWPAWLQKAFCMDNLAPSHMVYSATDSGSSEFIVVHDLASGTNPDVATPSPIAGYYGANTNNILNFGPYQFVVYVSSGTTAELQFFAKPGLTAVTPAFTTPSLTVYRAGLPTFRGWVIVGDRFYFGFISDGANKNFQSYYLTVDRCATRDGSSVCTDCVDGLSLYRVGTSPGNQCMTTAEFPAGYGIDTGSVELAIPCADTNCNDCKSSKDTCVACNSGWYLRSSGCYHPTTSPIIPDFFGANTLTGTVVSCQINPTCKLCKNDYQVCTGCDTATGWFLNVNVCQHATSAPTIPNRKGPDTVSGLVVNCFDTNCLLCKADFNTCTGCDTAAGWYLNGIICQHATTAPTIPDGKGPDTGTGLVVDCFDNHCLLCKANFNTCTGCDTAAGWYLDANTCKHATLAPIFPPFKGPNTVTGILATCSENKCKHCVDTFTTCTGCDTIMGWYLDDTTCKHAIYNPKIPSSKGPDKTSGLVVPCSDVGCLTCKNDFLICTACKFGFELSGTTCVPTDGCTTGYGKSPGDSCSPCLDSRCIYCRDDYAVCQKCDVENLYFLSDNSCVFHKNIRNGFGGDSRRGVVSPCTAADCIDCRKNFTTCLACNSQLGLELSNGRCLSMSQINFKIIAAKFFVGSATAQIQFSSNIKDTSSLAEPLDIIFTDTNQNRNITCEQIKCRIQSVQSDGFTLKFEATETIVKGDLYLNNVSTFIIKSEDGTVWTDYPIKVPDISFVAKKSVSQAAGSTLSTLNSARMPISIAISFAAPAAASFLDALINTIFVLKLIEGPPVNLPDSLLEVDLDVSLLPINIENPMQKWVANGPECTPSVQFSKYGMACNLIANQGVTILQMFALLIIAIGVTLLSNYLLRKIVQYLLKKNKKYTLEELEKATPQTMQVEGDLRQQREVIKKSRLARAVSRVGKVLGLQFILIKLEGNQIVLFLMSALAMKHPSRYSADVVSTCIALVYFLINVILGLSYFLASIWIWNQLEILQMKKKGKRVLTGTLKTKVNLSKSPYPILNYSFEELKCPDEYWKLLLPVVNLLRTTALSLAITSVLGKAWQQVTLVLMIEIGVLAFEIVSDVRVSRAEHYAEIVMRSCTISYLFFKLISTSPSLTDETRQANVGVPMMVCLIGLIGVGMVFTLWTIGVMIVRGVEMLVAKWKALKELKKLVNEDLNIKNESAEYPLKGANLSGLSQPESAQAKPEDSKIKVRQVKKAEISKFNLKSKRQRKKTSREKKEAIEDSNLTKRHKLPEEATSALPINQGKLQTEIHHVNAAGDPKKIPMPSIIANIQRRKKRVFPHKEKS